MDKRTFASCSWWCLVSRKNIDFFRKWPISWLSADRTIQVRDELSTFHRAVMGIKMTAKLVQDYFWSPWLISMTSSPNYDVIIVFFTLEISSKKLLLLPKLFRDSFRSETYFRLRSTNFNVTSGHIAISGLSKTSKYAEHGYQSIGNDVRNSNQRWKSTASFVIVTK